MIPFAFKIVWFVFALLGIPASWLVLIPFAGVTGVYWAPILYCLTITVLEGSFCLGMIWKMDPYRMPHAFCVVQSVLIAVCSHVLTGICACLTWATYTTVFKPRPVHQANEPPLAWRHVYLFFVAGFPVASSTAYIVLVLKLNAVQPSDDMHCDATSPLWPRVFSYAGAPLLMSLPCFIFSTLTAIRVFKAHIHTRRFGFSSLDTPVTPSMQANSAPLSPRAMRAAERQTSRNFLATNVKAPDERRRVEVKLDVHLPTNMTATQYSSHASLPSTNPQTPKTADTAFAASSSVTQFDPLPPLPLASAATSLAAPAPPSPTLSNKSSIFTDRTQTPSPITFAPVPAAKVRRAQRAQADSPELQYVQSFPDPGALFYPADSAGTAHAIAIATAVPGPSASSPASPSRERISLDDLDVRRGFHLPLPLALARAPDAPLRPSLELSADYARARLQEDREAEIAGEVPVASSSSATYPPLTRVQSSQTSASLKEEDEITLEAIGYKGRTLDGLREEEEGEHDTGSEKDGKSVLKEELQFDEEPEIGERVTRQFYRSARRTLRRPITLAPVIWRLVVFQLYVAPSSLSNEVLRLTPPRSAFFFILVLAALTTLIDLGKGRQSTPFGSQHFALLLAAWGPIIVFGHLPGVCERLVRLRQCR
ncbi:hypothetical protein FA95DRAFT_939824 [Auriscalpium vulgare]|uniref:Uncharacterized protein n=1 Tax=Auriscalpium vulgare TaxID=40419 RepID=A0ACB8S9A0_9AGAM|nr:hypothetical protein FA95DRAFT_939824 [Auriscalpium vulgare]